MNSAILVLNAGSSSLKFSVFLDDEPPRLLLGGQIDGLFTHPRFVARSASAVVGERTWDAGTTLGHAGAIEFLLAWGRDRRLPAHQITAVGHRVVHGGARFDSPAIVDAQTLSELEALIPLAPLHQPHNIAAIKAVAERTPAIPQVACFDTAFHAALPTVAQLLPLPRRFFEQGVRRFGFHGLAFTSVLSTLERDDGPPPADGRLVLAHLGSGASLAAVVGRRSVDTTMAFTPCSGLPMGTRSGDIDAGLAAWICRTAGLDVQQFDRMVRRESGLLGISETSPDVRDLLGRSATDVRAAQAIDVFCREVKKRIGACVAVLGGLDGLVFSGGIGENAAPVRARICEGLDVFGIRLDPAHNAAGAGVISADGMPATVRIIHADEEQVIAAETARLVHELRKKEAPTP